jgi:hypothetical protein
VAAVALTTLAGCTGSSSGGTAAPAGTAPATGSSSGGGQPKLVVHPMRAVKLAAAQATKAGSAHVSGRMLVSVNPSALSGGAPTGAGTSAIVRFDGDEQWSPTLRARLTMTGLPGFDTTSDASLTMLIARNRMYMRVPGRAREAGKPWLVADLADLARRSGVDIGSLASQSRQFDPSVDIAMLKAAGNLHRVGTEDVDGVATTHVAGLVKVGRALRQLTGSTGRQARAEMRLLGIRAVHVDLWIDARSQVRKEKVAMRSPAFALTVDMRVSRYGERVVVTPPPASKTTSLLAFTGALSGSPRT